MRPLILIFALLLISVSGVLSSASAGESKKGGLVRSYEQDYSDEDEDTNGPTLEETAVVGVLLCALCALCGGFGSWIRTAGPDSSKWSRDFPPRKIGEPLIPHFSVETSWQEAGVDVSALSLNAEAGYGPFAIEYRITRYSEEQPSGLREMHRIHGLYRMSYRFVEIDLGFGRLTMPGNDNSSGFSMTAPVKVYPLEQLGFEIRPFWTRINESVIMDTAFLVAGRLSHFTIKGGYRRVAISGAAFEGPMIAVGFNL